MRRRGWRDKEEGKILVYVRFTLVGAQGGRERDPWRERGCKYIRPTATSRTLSRRAKSEKPSQAALVR